MKPFRDLSIRKKLSLVILLTTCLALLLTCIGFAVYETVTFRSTMISELAILADTIGANASAALTFGDAKSGTEILAALDADQHLLLGRLYDSQGNVFAEYRRADAAGILVPSRLKSREVFTRDSLTLTREIDFNHERIGTILLISDLGRFYARLREYALIALLMLLTSVLAATLLSSQLVHVIADPIVSLAETAKIVSEGRDYSLRAIEHGRDEIGELMGAFNEMLSQIQQRDAALQAANQELEARVEERTAQLKTEIIDRERAQREAEERSVYLNALIQNSPLGIVVCDVDHRIQLCNPAFEQLFLVEGARVSGLALDKIIAPDANTPAEPHISDALMKGSTAHLVTRRRRSDGRLVDVEIHEVPLVVNGREVGALAIYQDIRERKRAEIEMQRAKTAAEEASRMKSEFLANMSHEIRTPMNGILGMTDLALDTELTSEQHEYLTMVKTSADSLLQVINDILDFSKVEAGKLDIDSVPFSLRDNVGDTIKAIGGRAAQKGLELACDIAPEVPDAVEGDPGRLRQVLVNLVGNAIKFTERGEVVVRVTQISQADQEAHLHFSVEDTGIGIPPERQRAIFEAFTQVDGTTTRRFGGTGLGLTISARLVELMGGRVSVESEIGKGSAFHFTIRMRLQKGDAARPVFKESANLPGLPVLIVDDNLTSRRILHQMLLALMMKPVSVESGKAALECLRRAHASGHPFSLVLIDAQMPEMDGFGLAERIKRDSGLSATPLILLTSAGERGDAMRCRQAGISGYLIKPVKQSELLGAVGETIGAAAQGNVHAPLVTRHSLRETQLRLRILLAEDNVVNQRLASRLLEKQGHTVTIARNGHEALKALEQRPFDLVLMDVQMPEMDGIEAVRAIRANEKNTGVHIPIVAMTAHAMKGDEERCLAAGMDSYVSKPIQVKKLFGAIATLFAQKTRIPAMEAEPASPAPSSKSSE